MPDIKHENNPTTPSFETNPLPDSSRQTAKMSLLDKVYHALTWTPPPARYDPASPPAFSMGLNLLFAFAATFTVANLYYSHPILNVLADDFDVTYQRVSNVPTLAQAGYAAGLLFLCPLGDIFRRRAFVIVLVFVTACLWIGLCITKSFVAFEALSFLTAVTTVTPQIMLPLVGGLAPPHRRASALSLVVSGVLLGILIARLLSGIITTYTSWRAVYWLSLGLQYLIAGLLWLFMPDYPSANPDGLNYFKMLWSIITLVWREPILLQACLIAFFTSAIFTSFWTTLTFLLASPPYNYSSLVIGLFALIGVGSMCFGPVYSRFIIDKIAPLHSVIIGEIINMVGVCIGTYIGTFSIAGPIIEAFAIDLGMQATQIANRSAIYGIAPLARNRVNTAYTVSVFTGQLMGTAAGNHLYTQGGWVLSGSASVGFVGASLVFCILRGPWEEGLVGWRGGWSLKQKQAESPPSESHYEEKSVGASIATNETPTER